jgi:4-amino-4-deoxy-L-arabinose transferase-like glycosyltransferase
MNSSVGKTALALWLFASILRLSAVLIWGVPTVRGIDQTEYLALAQNLRLHDTFSFGAPHQYGDGGVLNSPGPFEPTAARAPLYSAMIAALWWKDAPPLLAICILQALLGGFTVLFTYLIASRLFGARPALITGLIMSLAPLSVFSVTTILAEALFCFLLTLHIWLWDRQRAFASGLAMGAAILTRAILVPPLALIALAALFLKFNRRTHALILAGAFVAVVPWTIRNALTQHAFIPVASAGWGVNLLLGTRDVPYGAGNPHMIYIKDETFMGIIKTAPTETIAEALMFREGLQRIENDPLHWLLLRIKQYPRLFFEGPAYLIKVIPLPALLIRYSYLLGNAAFVGLALVGLWMARTRWREIYHVVLYPAILGATCFVGVVEERYSLPMIPMMAVFAGLALANLTRRKALA